MHTDSDTLHFLDDESDTAVAEGLVWRLMVIDDEPDVHRATTFALAGVRSSFSTLTLQLKQHCYWRLSKMLL